MQDAGAASIEEFVMTQGREGGDAAKAGLGNLQAYAGSVVEKPAYKKERFPYDNIKTSRELSIFDCIQAPCMTTCPVSQDIPGYMYHTARGEYDRAFQVIMASNPFPNIQGMVCDHLCQEKCTRLNYDNPLLIREIKRFIAQKYDRPVGLEPAPANGVKVAIIGAGPSGLACAHFLALAGFEVHIYEQKSFAGGWASDAIPEFRLDAVSIKKDIDAILSLGVQIHYNTGIDAEKFASLRQTHDYVYIGVGAQEGIDLGVPGEDAEGVMDQLEFLSAVRRGERPDLGKTVAVIGGGNSAMDAARTAKRLVGSDGEVSVLYRRTRREMPAAPEEIQALLDEGVDLVELTAPECMLVEDGRVTSNVCFRMELGTADASGRPRPIKIDGSEFELNVDSVISAIGQRVNVDFFPEEKLEINPISHETQLENVFAGGDAVRGASTLIKAIGDGKKVAESIKARALDDLPMSAASAGKISDFGELHKKRARRQAGIELPEIAFDERGGFDLVIRTLDDAAAQKEAARCLYCDEVCNACVTVCPNRANVGFQIEPTSFMVQEARLDGANVEILDLANVRIAQKPQVLNIGDYCNECGNCTTFCPTSGSPYLDKPKFHVTADSFAAATLGYYFRDDNLLEFKQDGRSARLEITADGYIYENEDVRATLDLNYAARKVELKGKEAASLRHAAEMVILCQAVRGLAPLNLKDRAY
jgi:putative selenate reductase